MNHKNTPTELVEEMPNYLHALIEAAAAVPKGTAPPMLDSEKEKSRSAQSTE